MRSRILRDLANLVDDVRRRGKVRVTHPQVDDVRAAPPRRQHQLGDLRKDIWRQLIEAMEFEAAVHRQYPFVV